VKKRDDIYMQIYYHSAGPNRMTDTTALKLVRTHNNYTQYTSNQIVFVTNSSFCRD